MRRSFFLLLLATSCTESTPNAAHPPPKASMSAAPSVAVAPSAAPAFDAGPALALPESKPGWKTVPKAVNGFYPVLDGLCSKLGFGKVGSDVIVHYGGESIYSTERTGKASFIALRDTGLESIGDPIISSPKGIAGKSFEDFWIADSTGSRSSSGAVLHRRIAGTWKQYAKDQTNLHPWLDGGIIGTGGFAGTNGDVWVEGSTTKPPASLAYGYAPFPQLAAFPTGEVILFGRPPLADPPAKGQTWFVRHWSPSTKTVQHTLPMFSADDWISVVEVAPDELYAYNEGAIAYFDGTSWKALAKPKGKKVTGIERSAKGEVWAFFDSGVVERTNVTTSVPIPMPEPLESIDGIDMNAPWAVGKSGKVYKRTGEEWAEVKIPGPAFGTAPTVKAKRVHVAAADDVLVLASYWEKAPSWSEQELHHMLIRTKAPSETMRCNEPDPENNNVYIGRGFQSWAPFATAECKTPFVVLARRSKQKPATPTESDWKAIRGALKGQGALGDGKLVELTSGDRTFLGAKAKDLESAKKIAQLASTKDRLRTEIVCGEPATITREIPLE